MLLVCTIIGIIAGVFVGSFLVEDKGLFGQLAMTAFGLAGIVFSTIAFSLMGLV